MVYSLCFLGMILLCQSHHVRLLHPVRFAGTPPPDPLQTPGISLSRACPRINLFALPFFSITYELPNLQALCFDIHTRCRGCRGYHTCSRLPTTLPLHLCESLCSRRLCVIFIPLSSTSHHSRITSHGFQTFRRRRILLHFSHCSRTKIGSVILSPS